jgi:hypothetical protein
VKAGGRWYRHDKLFLRVGERVHVLLTDYWEGYVTVSGGAVGCMHRICRAKAECARESLPFETTPDNSK